MIQKIKNWINKRKKVRNYGEELRFMLMALGDTMTARNTNTIPMTFQVGRFWNCKI